MIALTVALALAGVLGLARVAFSVRAMIALSLVLTLVQCYLGYWVVHLFGFLGNREWIFQELWLTRMGVADIAYGAFVWSVRLANVLVVFLIAGETVLWFRLGTKAGLISLFVVGSFRWLLNAFILRNSMNARTKSRPQDVGFFVWMPLYSILGPIMFISPFATGCLVAEKPISYVFGDEFSNCVLGVLFAMAGLLSVLISRKTVQEGYGKVARNLYRALEL